MATTPIEMIQGVTGKEIAVYGSEYDNSQIDQKGFLKVLLTYFKYQDPFEAEDISKFIDNTVKLRELEVMKNFEDSVKVLNDNNTLFLNTTNLIGKKIVYKGDRTYIESGKGSVEFVPKKNAQYATVYLYDADDNIVAQKEFTDVQATKRYQFVVDDPNIVDGYYRVSVVAKNGDERVDSDIYATALVSGIQKDGGDILVLFDKSSIKISDIVQIGGER